MAAGSILQLSRERLREVSYHRLGMEYVGTKVYEVEAWMFPFREGMGRKRMPKDAWVLNPRRLIARTLLSPSLPRSPGHHTFGMPIVRELEGNS